jgi:bifunctional non-homologous end joining protein LigD
MRRLEDFKPMLVSERPIDVHEPGWIFEVQYDGLRLMAGFGAGAVRLRTRNGADATRWFPEVTDSLAEVPDGPFVTDGEVCVLDRAGRSDFAALQERVHHRCWYLGAKPVVYCVFDLLVDRGVDITAQPLLLRKAGLRQLFPQPLWGILVVDHVERGARRLLKETAEPLGLKGLIAKRCTSTYRPGVRSGDWVKVKQAPRKARRA